MLSGRLRDFPKSPHFIRYTPLTADRSRILEEALNTDLMTTPKRTTTLPNVDHTKHCHYHCNFGHATKDCWALKDKIEELVQAGHLRRFVQSSQENRRPRADEGRARDRRDERGRRDGRKRREGRNRRDVALVCGMINTIAGGFAGEETTSSSRKRHFRAISLVYSIHKRGRRSMLPILFTNADFRTIDLKHNDLMVVTIEVANFVVIKTLIDEGSSVNILY